MHEQSVDDEHHDGTDFEQVVEDREIDRHDPDRDDDRYENWMHGENR